MNSKLENLDKGTAKLTIEVTLEKFKEGLEYSFDKNKNHFKIDGFRAGKAPRSLVEKMYGVGVLFEDAVNYVIPDSYENAVKEHKLEVVSRPEVDIVQIGEDKNFIYTAVVVLKPEVTLGEYKGVTIEKVKTEVTDEEIMEEIKKVAESNARLISVTDKPAKMGDIVTIDFEGFIDDVAFPGGKAEDYELTLGSKVFIDTFEEQLVGAKAGDSLEVTVRFPTQYPTADLAGKEAVFKVVVKDVTERELPEVDDSFAQDVSEFNTLEEYKNSIKSKLEKVREDNAKIEKENKVMRKIVEGTKMDVPTVMIENQLDKLIHNFEHKIKHNGLTLQQYVEYTGQTVEYMRNSMRNEAEEQVKVSLVLDAIVNAENIKVSEKEFDDRLTELSKSMNFDFEAAKAGLVGDRKTEFEDEIRLQKAVELVVISAVEK